MHARAFVFSMCARKTFGALACVCLAARTFLQFFFFAKSACTTLPTLRKVMDNASTAAATTTPFAIPPAPPPYLFLARSLDFTRPFSSFPSSSSPYTTNVCASTPRLYTRRTPRYNNPIAADGFRASPHVKEKCP